uniref:Chitin-binding type-2 domain-containing protein n=1 Tax=Anopheles melas TaxID=34690 RepID=A0A182TKV6_9DIPT
MYCLLALVYIVASCAWPVQTEPEPSEALLESLSSPAPGSWQCSRPGRFPNPDDPSCRTYLTCIPDGEPGRGAFTLRQDECGPSALFSGRYQRCITGTECAALEDFYAIEHECYECGKFVLPGTTDCRQFVNCLKTKDPGVYVPIRQSCPAGKLFSGEAHACLSEEEYECDATHGTTTPRPVTDVSMPAAQVADATFGGGGGGGHLSDFVCLSEGRFPDESVPHCRGYRWCTSEGTERSIGRLVSRNFLCDAGQVFSETEKRCVPPDSYQCPDDDVGVERFRCVTVGRFADRSAAGCERYFHCQQTATGTLRATLAQCPPGTVFSWLTTRCVPGAEYVCPVGAIGTDLAVALAGEETVAVVLPARKPPEQTDESEPANGRSRSHRSRCTSSGRFANDADAHCRTYFICTRDARGAWARVLVRCPAGTVFSRTAARCVGSETVPATFCTQAEPSTVRPRLEVDGGSRVAATAVEVAAPEDASDEELECSEPDRLLPNPTDRTCRTYFGCRWDSTESEQASRRLRLQLLQCPQGMVFTPGVARCMLYAPSRTDLEPPVADDMLDEGSSGAYASQCGEPDPGSGEPDDPSVDIGHLWTSGTSTTIIFQPVPTSAAQQSTGKPTTSTSAPTDKPARITPQDGPGEDEGGSFSYSGPVPEYPCTATGRFADINSVDCRSYFLCKVQQPAGSFVSVHLTCPEGMVFSRNVNKCIVSNRHVC